MRMSILLIGLLALPAFASQTVWKWVDDKGVVHLSDREVPGATKMEINSSNTRPGDAAPPADPDVMSPAPPVNTGLSYTSLTITKPVNDQTFVNTGGQVPVSIQLQPGLRTGHRLVLVLDGGEVKGYPLNSFQYQLKEIPRGSHTVMSAILDDHGTRLQQSAPVVFHVRQETIANPPVGPALKPPPKPRS